MTPSFTQLASILMDLDIRYPDDIAKHTGLNEADSRQIAEVIEAATSQDLVFTAVLQIGNTDNKLTQQEWSHYCQDLWSLMKARCDEIHFNAGSPGNAPWQNYCVIGTLKRSLDHRLFEEEVHNMGKHHRQDSVALIIAPTKFV